MSVYGEGYWGADGTYITTPKAGSNTVESVESGSNEAPKLNILDILKDPENEGLLESVQKQFGGDWKSNEDEEPLDREAMQGMLQYAIDNMENQYEIPMMGQGVEGLRFEDF